MTTFLPNSYSLTEENKRTKERWIKDDIKKAGHSDMKRALIASKWGLDDDKIRGYDDGEGPAGYSEYGRPQERVLSEAELSEVY